jgi:short-subunit dehydrogenase
VSGRYRFANGTAVVTGAASGIGAALAGALAARGSHLVLVDRDGERLASVAETVGRASPGVRIATYVVDLADGDAAARIGETLAATHPDTTLLVNNAGIALAGRFDQVTAEQFDAVLAVNFRAVVTLTRALLPVLTAHPGSHLVNLSSVFGLVAPAGQTAYCASKFAVRGFTEALRAELAPAGVGVTCVHPGGVRTNIARNALVGPGLPRTTWEAGLARFEPMLREDPAEAAETILRAVHRRRPRVLIGRDAAAMDVLARLLPSGATRVLSALSALSAAAARRS